MIRKCFLCEIELEEIIKQPWDLPGLGTQTIGFSICKSCGLVLQSPTVTMDKMEEYYSDTAVYINPGRNGKPSKNQIKSLKIQTNFVSETITKMPDSLFQVGCSNGYSISEFKKIGISSVTGIDPSRASHKLARELYGIETVVGTFEEYIPNEHYSLILVTHILEHLYNPKDALHKCSEMQSDGDWILIEVPLLERIDKLPPGYFAFEHLNYFSEQTLLLLIFNAGYLPYSTRKIYNGFDYPLISIIARKENFYKELQFLGSDFERTSILLHDYWNQERARWVKTQDLIKGIFKRDTPVYIWGAGIHTSQLFSFTDLKSYLFIKGLLDSSHTKWGKKVGDLLCHDPKSLTLGEGDSIIISSFASEKEIYENLAPLRNKGVNVVGIYGEY